MLTLRHKKSGYLYNLLRFGYHTARGLPGYFGTSPRICPVCDHHGRFLAFGKPPRFDALCPRCGALERHRLLRLLLLQRPELIAGRKVLHFAPERIVAGFLKETAARYTGADLDPGRADVVLNIEEIALDDASIDCVVCSHVLEHVDDRKALAEIFRILTPGGVAILMFPIIEGWPRTLEEENLGVNVKDGDDRFRYFGQDDHVRFYGRDARDRIRAAGFELDEFVAEEPAVSEYSLLRGETAFIAAKPVG